MIKWYEIDEQERIKQFYSKYTIEDFWNWWSDKQKVWMEIRTVDWKFAKQIAEKCFVYHTHSGVFVENALQLKRVIAFARDKQTIWFGVQPRKFSYDKWGKMRLGGGDNFINSIKFIFVDIDRQIKETFATNNELAVCDQIADIIIEKFRAAGFANSYCKVCSGNGVQLFIKLDVAINMPRVEYSKSIVEGKEVFNYVANSQFNRTKAMLYECIGKDMIRFVRKAAKDNNLTNFEIDKAGFKVAQVGALHCTKNYKYNGFRWRGIVDLQNGENTGLSDYIITIADKLKAPQTYIFNKNTSIDINKRLVAGHLSENILIKFMIEHDLPAGQRNNYLWMQIKCLLRDCKIDINSEEFKRIHSLIEARHGILTLNFPSAQYTFNEDVVNRFCINNLIPPIYPLWPYKVKENKIVNIVNVFNDEEHIKLPDETDILEDMTKIKKELLKIKQNNDGTLYFRYMQVQKVFNCFLVACEHKYGKDATNYYCTYVFDKYFNWI
jgi:hypothetical protein